jgi:hypothetical protein
MTLFAGFYRMDGADSVDHYDDVIDAALGRSGDVVSSWRSERSFVAKISISDDSSTGLLDDESPVSLLVTGHPLFQPDRLCCDSRDLNLRALRDSWLRCGPTSSLEECNGSFSLCSYDNRSESLLIAADSVATRPVYYFCHERVFFFSTAVRVLLQLPDIRFSMSLEGVAEELMLGVPLGARTVVHPIRVLQSGEYVTVSPTVVERNRYSDWAALKPTSAGSIDELADELYSIFLKGVTDRVGGKPSASCFLSGGLDSRVVASALVETGHEVRTLTYEYPGQLDGPLARDMAAALETEHLTVPARHEVKQRDLKAIASRYFKEDEESRTGVRVFSGDGGSVGLGYVYMDEQMVSRLRNGQTEAVLDEYLSKKRLPRKILRRGVADELESLVRENLRAEVSSGRSADPARDFHVFLMENDQRRHSHFLFEELDRRRTEYELPFLDRRMLLATMAAPVDWFLHHRFYYEWLKRFPSGVQSVPWQAYPGHIPCPIPMPRLEAIDQWQASKALRKLSGPGSVSLITLACSPDLPTSVIRRTSLFAAVCLHSIGARDCSHLWPVAETLRGTYRDTGREVTWPDPAAV